MLPLAVISQIYLHYFEIKAALVVSSEVPHVKKSACIFLLSILFCLCKVSGAIFFLSQRQTVAHMACYKQILTNILSQEK